MPKFIMPWHVQSHFITKRSTWAWDLSEHGCGVDRMNSVQSQSRCGLGMDGVTLASSQSENECGVGGLSLVFKPKWMRPWSGLGGPLCHCLGVDGLTPATSARCTEKIAVTWIGRLWCRAKLGAALE